MLSGSTILGGGLGGWLNTDYKASLSPQLKLGLGLGLSLAIRLKLAPLTIHTGHRTDAFGSTTTEVNLVYSSTIALGAKPIVILKKSTKFLNARIKLNSN